MTRVDIPKETIWNTSYEQATMDCFSWLVLGKFPSTGQDSRGILCNALRLLQTTGNFGSARESSEEPNTIIR